MNIGIVYSLLAAVTYALYAVGLKPFKDRLILFFWVNVFTYLAYLGLYFVRTGIYHHEIHPIQQLLFEFTFTNIPFYLIMACFWVGSIIIFDHLLQHYDVSLVMPVTQMGIVFTTLGYIALGSTFSFISLASITIVFVGALISAYQKLSINDPFGPLKKIPHALLLGGMLEAFLSSATRWVTFICTHETATTLKLHHWINNMFLHIYHLPFSFFNPFYYNVGVRFFIALVFIGYIATVHKLHKNMLPVLREHFWYIMGISTAFAASIILYHAAFFILEDKNVLTALTKLSIPLILVIGNFFLKEKVTRPKIVGCTLIVLGGMISLLA